MDLKEMIINFEQMAPQVTKSCCLVNGAFMSLNKIEQMGYDEFSMQSKINMPPKLYKYFPNIPEKIDGKVINHSIQALKNNTVFMQSPSKFDDVYDSDISLDYSTYERLRLMEYCRRCQIEVKEMLSTQEIGDLLVQALLKCFNEKGKFDSIFEKCPETEIEKMSNKLFCLDLAIELNKQNDLTYAVKKAIQYDYERYSERLKETFKTSCFATTPYSQLMWGGAYADCHRGFCVEYTVLPNEKKYKDVYFHLFPIIYCKVRPDMTERLAKLQDGDVTEEVMWNIYFHGALRKSIDWAYQNEWRLLMPMRRENIADYNVDFFPITKVFLGNRMSRENRREIIEICNNRNIPYVGVMRNPTIFEMQDCTVKCEDCLRYKENN